MKILVLSIKGGVGKSAIAINLAAHFNASYITNDLVVSNNVDAIQIEYNKRKIPAALCKLENSVLDFGAMYSNIDPKVSHATKICDIIVIPTLTDARSIQATIETYNLVKPSGKPIAIVINNFTKQKKFEDARSQLEDALGDVRLLGIRTTTLFERIAQDGTEWFKNIHNDKGEHQLKKSIKAHEFIYEAIINMADK